MTCLIAPPAPRLHVVDAAATPVPAAGIRPSAVSTTAPLNHQRTFLRTSPTFPRELETGSLDRPKARHVTPMLGLCHRVVTPCPKADVHNGRRGGEPCQHPRAVLRSRVRVHDHAADDAD